MKALFNIVFLLIVSMLLFFALIGAATFMFSEMGIIRCELAKP